MTNVQNESMTFWLECVAIFGLGTHSTNNSMMSEVNGKKVQEIVVEPKLLSILVDSYEGAFSSKLHN
jgi:hypothetical protein